MKKRFSLLTAVAVTALFIFQSCAGAPEGPALGELPEKIIDPATVEVPVFDPVEEYVVTDAMREKLLEWQSGFMNFSTNTFPFEMMAGLDNPDVSATEAYVRWNDLEPREGEYNWTKIDRVIDLWGSAGKKVEIRIVAADSATNITPRWVFDKYNIRRITNGQFFDFEMVKGGYTLPEGVERVKEADKVHSQQWSIYGDLKAGQPIFRLKNSRAVSAGKVYSAQVDYKAHTDGIYYMRFRNTNDGSVADDIAYWRASEGTSAAKSATFSINGTGEWVLEIGTVSGGAISLDNISIQEVTKSHSAPAYPNIFDPRFRAIYERMVKTVAERYKDNHVVEVFQVGPVGRWDEIMLDWQESGRVGGKDNFGQQWVAYGYTDQRYLDHIKWSMNLYRKYYPEHQLRINTAYGLPEVGDTSLIWRQAVELAHEKGIQIKQNGLQEKYFGYGGDNPFSWAADKSRMKPDSNTIYETAGQLYRNDTGVGTPIGHPITLLNCGIMQGVDGMFLYPDDIVTRRVRAYHHYAAESFGFPLINRWYTRFGSWAVQNETAEEQITWDNIWMRMRPYGSAGTAMTLTEIDGEKCTVSSSTDPVIAIDIDDRARFANPSGALIGVEYLDRGRDTFSVRVFDENKAQWIDLGKVTKGDSGEWKTASFAAPGRWLERKAMAGEDFFGEIQIHDGGDGIEAVRFVDLNLVDLSGYETESIVERKTSGEYVMLDQPVSAFFKAELPVNRIIIPLYASPVYQRNGASVKLYGMREDGEYLITEKEYYYFSDGGLMELNDSGESGFQNYRVEIDTLLGEVGWYLDGTGKPALTVSTFTAENSPVQISRSGEFRADLPFASVRISGSGQQEGKAVLQRKLDGNRWSDPLASVELKDAGRDGIINFPAQTAGIYKVSVDGRDLSVQSLPLNRRMEAKAAMPLREGEVVKSWTASAIGSEWTGENAKIGRNSVSFEGTNAAIISPSNLGIASGENSYFEITMTNTTASGLLRVFWADKGESFSPEKSTYIPVVANDRIERDYAFNFSLAENWNGTADRIKVELAQGALDTGVMEISRIAVTDKKTLFHRSCDSTADSLYSGVGMKDFPIEEGYMVLDQPFAIADSRSYIANFDAEPGQKVIIRLKNETTAEDFDLNWSSLFYNEEGKRQSRRGAVVVKMTPMSEEFETLEIDVAADGNWIDLISSLGVAFFHDEGRVLIDDVKVIQN